MKAPLYVIVDVSGSMLEGGKNLIAFGTVRAIEQYVRLEYGRADLKLVMWSTDAKIVEWMPDVEFPLEMLNSKGAADAEALIALIGEQPNGKILLTTDGFWSLKSAKAFKRWKNNFQQNTLRIIKVGADANPQLKGSDVFAAEDLFAVLNDWLEGCVK